MSRAVVPAAGLLIGLAAAAGCGRPNVGPADRAACQVQQIEASSGAASLLQLLAVGDEHYIGTSGLGSAAPLSVELRVLAGDRLDVDQELIALTLGQIEQQYPMPLSDARWTFDAVAGHACTARERALLYYLVREWFPRARLDGGP